jgi:hypothetical protein
MNNWFGIDAEERSMLGLSHSDKKHHLFFMPETDAGIVS